MMAAAKQLLLGVIGGAALLVLCGAGPAGNELRHVYTSSGGGLIYYDPASVSPLSKDTIGVLIKEVSNDGSTIRTRAEINCSSKIIREHEVIIERQNRSPEVSHGLTDWRAMELDPFLSQLFSALCK